MGIQSLMTAARAAGYAMVPPGEIFDDAVTEVPVRSTEAAPSRALVPVVPRPHRSRMFRRSMARARARIYQLASRERAAQWRDYVTGLIHGRATPA